MDSNFGAYTIKKIFTDRFGHLLLATSQHDTLFDTVFTDTHTPLTMFAD